MPLERFYIDYCCIEIESDPFINNAPKLKVLSVDYAENLRFIWENILNVSILSVRQMDPAGSVDYDDELHECQDIAGFFRALPNIENIKLNNDVLAVFFTFILIYFALVCALY